MFVKEQVGTGGLWEQVGLLLTFSLESSKHPQNKEFFGRCLKNTWCSLDFPEVFFFDIWMFLWKNPGKLRIGVFREMQKDGWSFGGGFRPMQGGTFVFLWGLFGGFAKVRVIF